MCKRACPILWVILALLLAGCCDQDASEALSGFSSSTAISSASLENVLAASTSPTGLMPVGTDSGVYLPRDVLYYYDFSLGEKVIACTQPGCKHSDTTCAAYLEQASSFAAYNGAWYIIIVDKDGRQMRLTRIDPATGSRKTICTVESGEKTAISYNNGWFSHGKAYISLFFTALDTPIRSSSLRLYQVDLDSGIEKTLLSCGEMESLRFLGASQNQVAVEYVGLASGAGVPLDQASYSLQFGVNADYSAYLNQFYGQNTLEEIRLYDESAGAYTVLADNKTDGLQQSPDPAICYQDQLIYQLHDRLVLYDLENHEKRELLSQKGIVNYWLLDGKVFYVIREEDRAAYRFFYADLTDGRPVQLKNQGNTERLLFSIHHETADKFIGIYADGSEYSGDSWILKSAFYADDYRAVQKIN